MHICSRIIVKKAAKFGLFSIQTKVVSNLSIEDPHQIRISQSHWTELA